MEGVVQRYIFHVIIIHWLGSESCTRIQMIIASNVIDQSFIKSMICYSKIELWCTFSGFSFHGSLDHQFTRIVSVKITRPMIVFSEILDIPFSCPCLPRSAIKPESWYFLLSAVRVHSLRLPTFAIHFFTAWAILETAFMAIFILPSVHVWESMSGGRLSLWWPWPASGESERKVDRSSPPWNDSTFLNKLRRNLAEILVQNQHVWQSIFPASHLSDITSGPVPDLADDR
jgi:hypothetical protein